MTDSTLHPTHFRRVVGHFGSGVTVITSRDVDGSPVGFTASSVASLSLEPLLVMVGVSLDGETLGAIRASGSFGVSILSRAQEDVARRFAGPARADRFRDLEVTVGASGSPLLQASIAWIDCRVHAEYPGGDHSLVVGRVEACEARGGEPLFFYRGLFGGWAT